MDKSTKVIQAVALASIAGAIIQRRNDLRKVTPIVDKTINNVLVLGSGGVMGVAWHAATLMRLEKTGQWNPSEDNLRIGTSAGSMVAIALGAGFSAQTILEIVTGGKIDCNGREVRMPAIEKVPSTDKMKSDKWYIAKTISHLRMPYPGLLMSSLLPEGNASMEELIYMVNTFTNNEWPETETWITSTDNVSGGRYVFNRESRVTPGFAVASSCAVPSIYKPLEDGSRHFIDGGIISGLHLDLAMHLGVKKITVLAPLSGLVKLHASDPWNVTMKKLGRNGQEVALAKAQIKAKTYGIELEVIRPRRLENQLLNKGSLMDSTLLPELVEATLN